MTPSRFTSRPYARKAPRHASEPIATPRLAIFSSLRCSFFEPSIPSQNVSDDMPSTT